MAVRVVEGRDYKILSDDYRKVFNAHNKPVKIKKEKINGVLQPVKYYRCMYCGRLISHIDMDVDHIIPKTRLKAGILWNPNKAWNLGPSCKPCNISKSNYIDGRVLHGFKSKAYGKFGIRKTMQETTSNENIGTTRAKAIALIVGINIVLTVSFFLGIALLGVGSILKLGWKLVKGLFRLSKFLVKKVIKYAFKLLKALTKKPIRNIILTGVAIVLLNTFIVSMGFGGLTLGPIFSKIPAIKNFILIR